MKIRKLLNILAVMLSSLASMVAHGKAQEADSTPRKDKKGEGEVSRHHRHHDDGLSSGASIAVHNPPHRSKAHANLDSDDIKNSKHAATWAYHTEPDSPAPPAPRLDASLMANAERSDAPLITSNATPPLLPGDEQSRYPWKRQIVTTTFWIGEVPTHNNPVPNNSSCWDPKWAQNFGGNDTPDATQRTSDYIPATFVPTQNPFYVALPYNDMEHGAHKAEAPQIVPWYSKDYKGPSTSVCKGRWIAIRFGSKVCYAQWEDAGPFRTDHSQYVFGKDRPRPNLNRGAGLDVSPAVRDFLGMNSSDVTDWKFVDFEEVPTGPWARFGENNTFVQNARKPGNQVAEIIPDAQGPRLRSFMPGSHYPAAEIR